MDVFASIRKGIASVAMAGILSTLIVATPVVTPAFAFSDVPTSHWAYEYVESLKNEGVLDASKSTFRPDDPVNRAELVKMVVEKTTGINDNLPSQPTFDDVAPGTWFYPYVETAVAQGIVQGYKDASGNLTGLFGPSDPVTRAAAAKIIAGGLGLPTYEDPAAPFDDVPSSAWFAGYVATVYNWSVVDGYRDASGSLSGKFGPADPVTRAQMAKMLVGAQTPVDRHPTGPDPDPDPDPIACETDDDCSVGDECMEGACKPKVSTGPAESGLEVVLSPLTPEAGSVPKTAFNTNYLTVELTNNTAVASAALVTENGSELAVGGEDLIIDELVITRRGVGSPEDFDQINPYFNGRRRGSSRTFNQETNEAPLRFAGDPVTIPKGDTVITDIRGDLDDTTVVSGSKSYFSIMSADHIKARGASTGGAAPVVGDFPIQGNTKEIVGIEAGTITVSKGTTPPATAAIGENQVRFGQVRAEETSGEEDVCIDTLLLENNGSVSPTDLSNLNIKDNSTGEKLAGPSAIGSDDRAFWDFRNLADGCVFIKQGNTRRMDIFGDINNGNDGDEIKFGLDEKSDMVAHGFIYDSGVKILDTSGGDFGTVKVEAGDVTFDFEDPNFRVPVNKDDIDIAQMNINNRGEPLLVRNIDMTLFRSNDVTGSVAFTTGDHFTNFELIELESNEVVSRGVLALASEEGTVVSGPTDPTSESDAANPKGGTGTATIKFKDDFEVANRGTTVYKLRVDTEKDLKTGEKYQVGFTPSTDTEIEGLVTNDDVPTADLQAAEINTGDFTIDEESLNIILANTPVSDTVVRGNKASVLGLILRAGEAGSVRITNLVLEKTAAATFTSSDIINFELRDATGKVLDVDQISGAETGPTFDSLEIIIPAGEQRTVYVYVTVSTSATAGDTIALKIDALAAKVSAENDEGDPVDGDELLGDGVAGATVNVASTRIFTVVASGELEVSESPSNPDGKQVQLGSVDVETFVFEAKSKHEDVEVQNVAFAAEDGDHAQQFSELKLFADGQEVATTTFNNEVAALTQMGGSQPLGTANRAEFNFPTGAGVNIPQDTKVSLTVKATYNKGQDGAAESGQKSRLIMKEVEVRGSKEDVLPVVGKAKTGTGSLTGGVLTGPTDTTLALPIGSGGFEHGDQLRLNDGTRAAGDEEQAVVESFAPGTGILTIKRAINRSTVLSGAVACTDALCKTHGRIVSNDMVGLNTLLTGTLHSATLQGNVSQPIDSHDLFVFTLSAAENTKDSSDIQAVIRKFRATITGSAKASDFKLRNYGDQRDISGVVVTGGAHIGRSSTELVFDLTGVTDERDDTMDDGESITYSIRAKVDTGGADGDKTRSLTISIARLGDENTRGFFTSSTDFRGDIHWVDINSSDGALFSIGEDVDGDLVVDGHKVDGRVDQAIDNITPAGIVYLNAADTGFTALGPRLLAALYNATTDEMFLIFDQAVFSDASGATADALAAGDFTVVGTLVMGANVTAKTAGNIVVFPATTDPVIGTDTVAPTVTVFSNEFDSDSDGTVNAASGLAAQTTAVTVTADPTTSI